MAILLLMLAVTLVIALIRSRQGNDDTAAINLRTPRGVPLDLTLLQEFLKQTPKETPLALDWSKTFTFPVGKIESLNQS